MTLLATTEYVFNAHRDRLSHLVVEDTFAMFGDAATVCGLVVTGADLFPGYTICDDCTSSSSSKEESQ